MTGQAAQTLETHEANAQAEARLVGWLISYGMEENGVYFEIRSGRSFISSKPVAGQKYIELSHGRISPIHAALKATRKHKVFLQDTFSEHGTFIKKSGSEEEESVQSPVELNHGDWIRFGTDIRFQVCLIDGAGK